MNYLEASEASVPEQGGQATGDKLHADVKGDDILVGRDGQKQKPRRPAILSCPVVVQWFEYLVLSLRPWLCPLRQHAGNWQQHQETLKSSLANGWENMEEMEEGGRVNKEGKCIIP